MALMAMQSCATPLPPAPPPNAEGLTPTVALGRAVAVITGERQRIYEPQLRSMELINRDTKDRYTVKLESEDRHFVLSLLPGEYELNRVQISEGPFLSMANVSASFMIGQEPITYLGTWRFGVDSPKYGRMVAVSMVLNEDERTAALTYIKAQYPELDVTPVADVLPQPSTTETRLYEVMPYPRYPRYFRRHLW
jgi:hypothetical protein